MLRYLYEATFKKQTEVNPVRSTLGCLIAMAMMVGVAGGISWLLLPKGVAAQAREAENEIRALEEALLYWEDQGDGSPLEALRDDARGREAGFSDEVTRQSGQVIEVLMGWAGDHPTPSPRVVEIGKARAEYETDPWGQEYRVYVGPLPEDEAPLCEADGDAVPRDLPLYIWSLGQDGVNNQAYARLPQAECGADDINNWDADRSWRSRYR